jgi:hypothetical protein
MGTSEDSMGSSGPPWSPILDEALAAALQADVRLAPDVLTYLSSKYNPEYRVTEAPGRDESTMRQNTAYLISEAAALTGGAGGELDLPTLKNALAGLCRKFPDFWPFCPP